MFLVKFEELKKYASKVTMRDIFSNHHRSMICNCDGDTYPGIPENIREVLNNFLINSPYYWGENWYGRQLVENHPEFIPLMELKKWYIEKLIDDIRLYIIGQWWNIPYKDEIKYQKFLISESIVFRKEIRETFEKMENWKQVKYKVLSILDGISRPESILDFGY